MDWIELSAEAEAEAVEAVAELFSEIGHGGVAIEQPVTDSAERDAAEIDPNRLVTVKTYLPEGTDVVDRVSRAREGLWHLSRLRRIEPLRVTRLAEEDWAEAWKRFFFVQRVGERLVIKPTWREYQPAPGEVVLELDPGMAFGTGLHPSTRMCLTACERYVEPGMRVLDLGTGSGVLAIAAARLGAASVLALDVDAVAVEVARKNVAQNGLKDRIQVLQGSLDRLEQPQSGAGAGAPAGPPDPVPESSGGQRRPPLQRSGAAACAGYSLVLANIIARVIVELAPGLHDATAPGGLVVASGIIAEREEWTRGALESAGLRITEIMSEGDWRAVVCRRERA